MPKVSLSLISLLTVVLNGFFCVAIAAEAIALPSAWIVLLVLTVGCGVLYALTTSLIFPQNTTSTFRALLAGAPALWFWLSGVLFLVASALLYFLLVGNYLPPDFQRTVGSLSWILFGLGTLLPTLLILVRTWQRSQMPAIASRSALVAAVSVEVDARQQQSLHAAVQKHLVRETPTQEAHRLWDVEVKIGKQPKRLLHKEQRILEFLEREAKPEKGVEALNSVDVRADAEAGELEVASIGGKILILGAPGSGKTSTLLELAADLCDRAAADESAPVPVVLDLVSWGDNRSLASWVMREVCAKYGVRVELVRELWESDRLLPLLDGLDELDATQQEQCLQAIQQAHRRDGRSLPLVVCSRMDSYQRCENRLRLYGAIGLQPLSETQIQDYLMASRSRELWENIKNDPSLLRLARTPLLLNLIALAYEEILIHSWKRLTSREERQRYVLNAYIRRQLARDIYPHWYHPHNEPNSEQTKHWLRWLAITLKEGNQNEFSLEKIPSIRLGRSWMKLIYPISIVLAFVVAYSLIFGLIYGPEVWNIYGIWFGVIVLCFAAVIAVKAPSRELKAIPDKSLWLSAVNSVMCALIGWLSFHAIGMLLLQVGSLQNGGTLYVLSVVLFSAAIAPLLGLIAALLAAIPWLEHLTLRLLLWRNGDIPWNYTRFLNYAAERLFLKRVGDRYRFIHPFMRDRLID